MFNKVYNKYCDGPQGVAYAQRLGPNTVYILAGEERRELLLHLKLDRFLIKDAPGPCTEPVGRRPGTGPTPFPGLSARNTLKSGVEVCSSAEHFLLSFPLLILLDLGA